MNTMATMTTYNSRAPLVAGRTNSVPQLHSANPSYPASPEVAKSRKISRPISKTVDSDGVRRYRNKDPYAIDSSEDEDEDYGGAGAAGAQAAKRPGESIKFSKLDASGVAAAMPTAAPNVAPSFRAEAPPGSGLALNGVSYTPTLSSNEFGGEPPAKASTKAPTKMQSSTSTPTLKTGSPRLEGEGTPRTPNKAKMEVRAATASRAQGSSTRDLADFLRSSGPPEPSPSKSSPKGFHEYDGGAPSPNIGGGHSHNYIDRIKEESKKKFWSRKRYLDMP